MVEHWSAESDCLRFDSSGRLRIFSLSHARDKTKNIFLYLAACWNNLFVDSNNIRVIDKGNFRGGKILSVLPYFAWDDLLHQLLPHSYHIPQRIVNAFTCLSEWSANWIEYLLTLNVDDRGVIEPLLSFIDLRIHLIDSDGCDIILQNRQFKYEPNLNNMNNMEKKIKMLRI